MSLASLMTSLDSSESMVVVTRDYRHGMGQTGARSIHAVWGGCRAFTGLPLGQVCRPGDGENAENVMSDTVYLVCGEDAEETGDDGEAGFVVGEKGAKKSQSGGETRAGAHGHAVIESLQEMGDAAGRVGEGEHGPALDGGGRVDGADDVMEDGRVAHEETPVDDEVIRAGEEDDVAVDKGEIGVSDELAVGGHDQVIVGIKTRRPSNSVLCHVQHNLARLPNG